MIARESISKNFWKMKRAALSRDAILGIVGLVALIAAVGILARGWSGKPNIPIDESTWVYFKCKACGARFYLDGREMEAEMQRFARGGKGSGVAMVRCKQCGQEKAVREDDDFEPVKEPG